MGSKVPAMTNEDTCNDQEEKKKKKKKAAEGFITTNMNRQGEKGKRYEAKIKR